MITLLAVQSSTQTVADPGFLGRGPQPLSLGQKPIIWQDFKETCMKLKEIRPSVPSAHP